MSKKMLERLLVFDISMPLSGDGQKREAEQLLAKQALVDLLLKLDKRGVRSDEDVDKVLYRG
jgi:hypothetical protein